MQEAEGEELGAVEAAEGVACVSSPPPPLSRTHSINNALVEPEGLPPPLYRHLRGKHSLSASDEGWEGIMTADCNGFFGFSSCASCALHGHATCNVRALQVPNGACVLITCTGSLSPAPRQAHATSPAMATER